MGSRRCPDCLTNWPLSADFQRCPDCCTRTDVLPEQESIGLTEGRRRAAHALFEREYEARELGAPSKCGPPRPPGPSPEELGAAEARAQIEAWRQVAPAVDDALAE